ncbi:MAG: competence/damage-inducible protein A [Dethiobacter sp.]|jgi:nicotinamide-nucleotide amidase|nr:competence/damage-inducible protein A [Dethiobacter sp.]MCL4462390.1 competence/damage-inducible protein A [Bacillota bacterium]MCL5994361.1 competence/damage-inducible protein A [Bacillota bacterium]
MKTEIIAVGTELLLGQIANTNARFLSEKLAEKGINVYWHTVVGDNPARLAETFSIALTRADLIIFSGGLGPTIDDLTKETVAEVLNLALEKDEAWTKELERIFARLERVMTDNNYKQALIPRGARLLINDHGTAPGIWLEHGGKILVLLPGPPRELMPMFTAEVLPLLPEKDGVILSRVLKITGLGESAMEERIADLVANQTNPTIAPLAKDVEVHLRLTAKAATRGQAQKLLDATEAKLLTRLGETVFARDEESMAGAVAGLLFKRNQTIAVAESCTGGLLAHMLTNVSGSSAYFMQGQVVYSNRSKTELLGVQPELIEKHGAVSEEVARKMAENLRRRSSCDFALAITGVAGPTGGTAEKPVGLVFIAIAKAEGISCRKFNFIGNRETIKERAVMAALNMLRLYLLDING